MADQAFVPQDAFTKCTPSLRADINRCGGSTICDMSTISPDDLASFYQNDAGKFNVMDSTLRTEMLLAACGAKLPAFVDFLMKNRVADDKKVAVKKMDDGTYRIEPYFQVMRKWPINNDLWVGQTGLRCDEDGTTNPAGTYLKMNFTSQTSIPNTTRYFNIGMVLHIVSLDSSNVQHDTDWKITSSALAGDGTYVQCILYPMNSASFLPSTKLGYPVDGIVTRQPGNVQPTDSDCSQAPGLLTNTLEQCWWQWTRLTYCENELVEEYIAALMAHNLLASTLYTNTLVEHNRQVAVDYANQKAWMYFYGAPLDNQRIETLDALENVEVLMPSGTFCRGKRANAIGWYQQHAQCGRVADLGGATLQIEALATSINKMYLIRQTTGHPNPELFEVLIPSQFMPAVETAMISYYKRTFGSAGDNSLRFNIDWKQSPLGLTYMDFQLKYPNVTLRFITDSWYDRQLDQAYKFGQATGNPKYTNVKRQMWIMDWSKNYTYQLKSQTNKNIIGGPSNMNTLANADYSAYACRAEVPQETKTFLSEMLAPYSECPAGDLILTNMSGNTPDIENHSADYDDNAGGENPYAE